MYFVTLYAQVLLTWGGMAGLNEADGALIIYKNDPAKSGKFGT